MRMLFVRCALFYFKHLCNMLLPFFFRGSHTFYLAVFGNLSRFWPKTIQDASIWSMNFLVRILDQTGAKTLKKRLAMSGDNVKHISHVIWIATDKWVKTNMCFHPSTGILLPFICFLQFFGIKRSIGGLGSTNKTGTQIRISLVGARHGGEWRRFVWDVWHIKGIIYFFTRFASQGRSTLKKSGNQSLERGVRRW